MKWKEERMKERISHIRSLLSKFVSCQLHVTSGSLSFSRSKANITQGSCYVCFLWTSTEIFEKPPCWKFAPRQEVACWGSTKISRRYMWNARLWTFVEKSKEKEIFTSVSCRGFCRGKALWGWELTFKFSKKTAPISSSYLLFKISKFFSC